MSTPLSDCVNTTCCSSVLTAPSCQQPVLTCQSTIYCQCVNIEHNSTCQRPVSTCQHLLSACQHRLSTCQHPVSTCQHPASTCVSTLVKRPAGVQLVTCGTVKSPVKSFEVHCIYFSGPSIKSGALMVTVFHQGERQVC